LNAQDVPVGYCVSTLNLSKVGEIESIYVDENFRHLGIGDTLIRKALSWMDSKGAISKVVEVGAGNEQVFSFCERYGFFPRKTVLKQVTKAQHLFGSEQIGVNLF
jgi:ribosomal protein S18 acetylase RimI-like enzyme